jgi:hypothetical protein
VTADAILYSFGTDAISLAKYRAVRLDHGIFPQSPET